MGVRATRSKEYTMLQIDLLKKDSPKAYERFVGWYSVLSYKPGYYWVKDRPGVLNFLTLPLFIRMAILMEFTVEFNLLPEGIRNEAENLDNIFERDLHRFLMDYEARL